MFHIMEKQIRFEKGDKNHPWVFSLHYENTPIQIYRKFHLQKLKIFR